MIPRTSKFWQTSSKNSTLYPFSEKASAYMEPIQMLTNVLQNTYKADTSKTNLIMQNIKYDCKVKAEILNRNSDVSYVRYQFWYPQSFNPDKLF